MARPIAVLAGLCVASLFRPLGALCAWQVPSDGVLLIQETARVHVGRDVHAAQALTHEGLSETGIFLPSLVQISLPVLVVGVALVALSLLWSCRGLKGTCCCFSGCCGGSLLFLALALIIAKVVLSRMAGPAPAGPMPVEPPVTKMEVEGRVPFTVVQVNTPGPIHDVYKQGMQTVMNEAAIATGQAKSSIDVLDVEARAASEELAVPVMISVDGMQKPVGDRRSEKALEDLRSGRTCEDNPADWQSSTGYSCQDYSASMWCTLEGGYGSGWGESWGTFQDYATSNKSALTVCCVCGGGYRASQSQQVYLSYTLSMAENMSLRQASAPDITNSMVNKAVAKMAGVYSQSGAESVEGLQAIKDLASGEYDALQGDAQMHVSVSAHFRCQVHHSLNSDVLDAARILAKRKMPEVKKALETAAKGGSSLPLVLADRCNDPSQLEAMHVCLGSSLMWADLVSIGSVSVPFNETVEDFLCRKSCDIQDIVAKYQVEVMKEANEHISGFSLDEHTVWGTKCFPFLDKSNNCPICG